MQFLGFFTHRSHKQQQYKNSFIFIDFASFRLSMSFGSFFTIVFWGACRFMISKADLLTGAEHSIWPVRFEHTTVAGMVLWIAGIGLLMLWKIPNSEVGTPLVWPIRRCPRLSSWCSSLWPRILTLFLSTFSVPWDPLNSNQTSRNTA